MRRELAACLLFTALASPSTAADSQCFGTVNKGRIENSVALPTAGPNFTPYSRLGITLGRTHVHAKVAEIVTAAYAELAQRSPDVHYVFATPRGPYLQQHLSFMKAKPWVRHDEHYHVDFAVPCKL